MKFKVKSLNEAGIQQIPFIYETCKKTGENHFSDDFLQDPRYTEELEFDLEVKRLNFKTKYELASYIVQQLRLKEFPELAYRENLWTWLALFYYETVTEKSKGKFKIGAYSKYIANNLKSSGRKQRHSLFFACRLVYFLGESAKVILSAPADGLGHIYDSLGDFNSFMYNKNLNSFINYVFYDNKLGRVRPNSNDRAKVRRFFQLMKQIRMTCDIEMMDVKEYASALPETELDYVMSLR